MPLRTCQNHDSKRVGANEMEVGVAVPVAVALPLRALQVEDPLSIIAGSPQGRRDMPEPGRRNPGATPGRGTGRDGDQF
jgi:hypothetical protein